MTITPMPSRRPTGALEQALGAPVAVSGARITIRDLTLDHAEAAAYLRDQTRQHGEDALLDLVRRAFPVGLVALAAGTAALDTSTLSRTITAFEETLSTRSAEALEELDRILARLRDGEATLATTARAVLDDLPDRVERALAGEGANVRAAVAEATRAVQAVGMQQLADALRSHSDTLNGALSLDHEGPVRMLRQDVLSELASTRQDLAAQLATLRGLVERAQGQAAGRAKSSRAIGTEWETEALATCEDAVVGTGDRFEPTGNTAGPGTTRRVGDALAHLGSVVTGPGRDLRVMIECKHRTRSLSARDYAKEIAIGCQVREAQAGLVVVPSEEEVPGPATIARVSDLGFVVVGDPAAVRFAYLMIRELLAVKALGTGSSEVDIAKVESRITTALHALAQFDEVGRQAMLAEKNLAKIRTIGKETRDQIQAALREGIALLHG